MSIATEIIKKLKQKNVKVYKNIFKVKIEEKIEEEEDTQEKFIKEVVHPTRYGYLKKNEKLWN